MSCIHCSADMISTLLMADILTESAGEGSESRDEQANGCETHGGVKIDDGSGCGCGGGGGGANRCDGASGCESVCACRLYV